MRLGPLPAVAMCIGILTLPCTSQEEGYDYLGELEDWLLASIGTRYDVTKEDLHAFDILCGYIESHDGKFGRCPSTGGDWVGVQELSDLVNFARFESLVEQMPKQDGWGREYMYMSDGSRHAFASFGPDGKPGKVYSLYADREEQCGAHQDPEGDFVIINGRMCVWLEKQEETYMLQFMRSN